MRILVNELSILIALLLASCNADRAGESVAGRWYSQQQVAQGGELFQAHCAVCHGEDAQGTQNWFVRDENGNYPPPPLDGTAHAWHHPLPVLLEVIANGGVPLGGVMPGFSNVLSEQERLAVIAYFQSKWPDDIYEQWSRMNQQAIE